MVLSTYYLHVYAYIASNTDLYTNLIFTSGKTDFIKLPLQVELPVFSKILNMNE